MTTAGGANEATSGGGVEGDGHTRDIVLPPHAFKLGQVHLSKVQATTILILIKAAVFRSLRSPEPPAQAQFQGQ